MVSTGLKELDQLLGNGYPDRSSILVMGPPGIGKEAVGYSFTQSGLNEHDFCLYITRQAVSEVLHDIKGFNIQPSRELVWFAAEGSQEKLNINDLTGISFTIKDILRKAEGRRVRVVADVLSSLLMLNPADTIYRFLSQLLMEIKQHDAVFLATIDEGMHQPQALAAMEQLFDGVMELRLYDQGFKVVPLLWIRKMRGVPPQLGCYRFSFKQGRLEVTPYVKQ